MEENYYVTTSAVIKCQNFVSQCLKLINATELKKLDSKT